ncbi:MAG TPA: TraB/GumN family protein [Vicinamibacterales bacterium]|nr:TraB/GumN family protein [Vicinamibacterales bacterium]
MRNRSVLRTSTVAVALFVAATAAQARSFGWKVTGKTGVIYVVGSVHLLSNDFYPLPAPLEAAYKDADLLVEEVDMAELTDPTSQLALLGRAMLPSATPLEKVISADTYAMLVKRAAALGVPIEPFKLLKPWMAALTLVQVEWQQAGFDPQLGLDRHFYDQATADGKTTQGLETAEYQISRLDGMTMEQQEHLLAESLKEAETEKANMKKLVEAWRAGDSAAVEKIVLADLKAEPVLYQRLLVERNRNWLPKIEALFARPRHALVVVGAAHLVGPDGLLAALRAKGYTVEQL